MMINVTDNNKVYYYHFDGLGSVAALSDSSADIVEKYSYDVFGRPNSTSGVNNPYFFTGRAYDNETGLYYYRARYYDYTTGRFLQADPIGYSGGMNLYAYVGNNPLMFVDPFGLIAHVTIDGDNNVEITIPIIYEGPGASKSVTKKFNNAIEKYWTGQFGKYNVKTTVVTPVEGDAINKIVVPKGWENSMGGKAAYVVGLGGNSGEWPEKIKDFPHVPAHEAGHLIGVIDRYDEKIYRETGKVTPIEGWEGNLMAGHFGYVDERNIQELLEYYGLINKNGNSGECKK